MRMNLHREEYHVPDQEYAADPHHVHQVEHLQVGTLAEMVVGLGDHDGLEDEGVDATEEEAE